MVECPRCGSERIFGGRCLDCGEVLGSVGRGGRGFKGPPSDDLLAGSDENSGYLAHHVLPFELPAELRQMRPRTEVASLNQPTMFSMVKAIKRPNIAEGDDPPELEWPTKSDAKAPPTDAKPPDPLQEGEPTIRTPRPAFDGDSLIQVEPLPDFDIPARGHTGPTTNPFDEQPVLRPHWDGQQSSLDIQRTPPPGSIPEGFGTLPPAPPGPSTVDKIPVEDMASMGDMRLGDVPDSEIFGRYSGTLMNRGAAPVRATRTSSGRITAVLVACVVSLAVGLVLYDQARVGNTATEFEERTRAELDTLLQDDRISADTLLAKVEKVCGGPAPVTCDAASAWVRQSDPKAYQAHHGTPPPDRDKPTVIIEAGFTVTATSKGALFATETRTIRAETIALAAPTRVTFSERAK